MSNAELIKAPATCHKCNVQFISPTTGLVDSKCYKCGGDLTTDQPQNRPKIVCICGSSRFVGVMAVEAWRLEKCGIMALAPHLLPQWYEGVREHHQAEAEGVAHILDELHLRKIDMADEVFVVNPRGYIGERTSTEIGYAKEHGKPVRYLESV